MLTKPTQEINWGVTGTAPSAPKKASGYAQEGVPFEEFNWLFYVNDVWNKYLDSVCDYILQGHEYDVLISSVLSQSDYNTIQDYLLDTPQPNDRILIAEDQVLSSKLILPDGIKIKTLKGIKFTTVSNLAELFEIGNDVEILEDCIIEANHTGLIGEAVILNGHNIHVQNLIVINNSTGTITDAIRVEAAKKGIQSNFLVYQKTGTITNALDDLDNVELSNDITVLARV